MSESNRLTEFYDGRYAEGYMEDWPERKKQRVGELFRQLGLPQRGRALDFECDQGVFTHVLQTALAGWKVYGTELSEVALRIATRRVPDCTFITGDRFGHRIATLHRNGIDRSAHDRFFFDDEGHVRRLTSSQLVDAAARHEWQIGTARFANHYWGAIEWMTGLDLSFIGTLTDDAHAVDRRARMELLV